MSDAMVLLGSGGSSGLLLELAGSDAFHGALLLALVEVPERDGVAMTPDGEDLVWIALVGPEHEEAVEEGLDVHEGIGVVGGGGEDAEFAAVVGLPVVVEVVDGGEDASVLDGVVDVLDVASALAGVDGDHGS